MKNNTKNSSLDNSQVTQKHIEHKYFNRRTNKGYMITNNQNDDFQKKILLYIILLKRKLIIQKTLILILILNQLPENIILIIIRIIFIKIIMKFRPIIQMKLNQIRIMIIKLVFI